jgi:predicted transcriptional regulator
VKAKRPAVKKASSVRITREQYDKFQQLAEATHSSINKWFQRAADQFLELEWETRMTKTKEVELRCAQLRDAKRKERTQR